MNLSASFYDVSDRVSNDRESVRRTLIVAITKALLKGPS